MTEKQEEHEGMIRKILEHEITLVVSIVAIVIAVVNYIVIPIKLQGQQLDIIQNNHLHTIEQEMIKITASQERGIVENNSAHAKIVRQLTETATILDQHLKNAQ